MDAGAAAENPKPTVDVDGESGEDVRSVTDEGGRDETALAALVAGDRGAALSLIARGHGVALGRYCMSLLGTRSEADDVVRAALLALDGAQAQAEPGTSLRALLMRTVRRDCARRLEGRRTQAFRVVGDEELASDVQGAAHERARTARAAIAALRPTEREALIARFVAQLSYPEIASAWEVEEAEVRRRVSRALATLAGAPS